MSPSCSESYNVGPNPSQIHNMHDSQFYVHYMTQAQPIFDPTPLGTEPGRSWSHSFDASYNPTNFPALDPLSYAQRQPTCPSSQSFPARTPSQSRSTCLSVCSAGLVRGVKEGSNLEEIGSSSDRNRRRGCSGTILTPSTSEISTDDDRALVVTFDQGSGLGGGTYDHPVLLRGINVCKSLDFHAAEVQFAEELIECAETQRSDSLGPQPGLMSRLSTHASNQSRQEARPWNEFASQHDDRIVLPGNVEDKDLSFPYDHCFGLANQLSSHHGPNRAITEQPASFFIESQNSFNCNPEDRKRKRGGQNTSRNNLQVDRGASSSARHLAVSPTSSANSPNSIGSRGGRQEGYRLSEEDRISAHGVRDQGSCFRCWCMKEKCTHGRSPCERCRRLTEGGKLRLWMTPCSNKRLEERCEYLLPASLASQVGISSMRAFLKRHTCASLRRFLLNLSPGFGEPWTFWAVELVPGAHELDQTFGFHRHADVKQERVSAILLTNPPVVPLWIDPLLMQINIDCWLDKMIGNPNAGWQRHWFFDPSQIWQLSILKGICQHYQHRQPAHDRVMTTAFQTLGCALKSAVLNYLMSHALLVPQDNIDHLFQHLDNPSFKGRHPEGMVCPRGANKFVKMMVLPLMRLATEKTLSGLHDLFRTHIAHETIWDDLFAIVFLCLMMVSSTQRSLFQRVILCSEKNDSSFSREHAVVEADSMNCELVVHIIGMFHDKFRTTSKSKSFNPLREANSAGQPCLSEFAAQVRMTTDIYCECLWNLRPEHGLTPIKINCLPKPIRVLLEQRNCLQSSCDLSFQDHEASRGFPNLVYEVELVGRATAVGLICRGMPAIVELPYGVNRIEDAFRA